MSPLVNGLVAAVVIGGAAFLGHSPGDTGPVPSAVVSDFVGQRHPAAHRYT